MMLITERFIASAMSLVRIAPEAPTRAPAMIRTGLSRTKPAIATAVPVKLFRRLMTTGMSAPPIGRVIVTPKTSAAARITSMTGTLRLPDPQVDRAGDDDQREGRRHELPAGDHDRPRRRDRETHQLARGDERAGEGDRADDDVEDRRDVDLEARAAAASPR